MEQQAVEQESEGGMTMTQTPPARTPAGEIIAVATTTFTAQSYELNEAPPFGSLLRVANPRRMTAGGQAALARAGGPREDDGDQLDAGGPGGGVLHTSTGRQDTGGPRGDDGDGQAASASVRASGGRELWAGEAGGDRGIVAYYALCYGSQTGSIEPGRHAVAWGRFEDDEDDIYRRQPQLAQVLRTTFDALLVGYETEAPSVSPSDQGAGGYETPARHRSNGYVPTDTLTIASSNGAVMVACDDSAYPTVVQRVPATPPRLHALVGRATPAETAHFNRSLTYLRFVLRANLPLADDFIAAAIMHAHEACGYDETFLLDAARSVARLLGGEHERVMNILELLDD